MEALLLTTASTPDRTCRYVRCRHARPSSGSDGACRRRRSFPSRSARSTPHRASLAGTSWAGALGARGSWLVSSCGPAPRNRAPQRKVVRLTCHVVGCRRDLYEIGVTHGVLHPERAAGPHDRDASCCWRLGMARPPRLGFRAPSLLAGGTARKEKISSPVPGQGAGER